MTQAIINFDEEENKKLTNLALELRLSKSDTVKWIIKKVELKKEKNEK